MDAPQAAPTAAPDHPLPLLPCSEEDLRAWIRSAPRVGGAGMVVQAFVDTMQQYRTEHSELVRARAALAQRTTNQARCRLVWRQSLNAGHAEAQAASAERSWRAAPGARSEPTKRAPLFFPMELKLRNGALVDHVDANVNFCLRFELYDVDTERPARTSDDPEVRAQLAAVAADARTAQLDVYAVDKHTGELVPLVDRRFMPTRPPLTHGPGTATSPSEVRLVDGALTWSALKMHLFSSQLEERFDGRFVLEARLRGSDLGAWAPQLVARTPAFTCAQLKSAKKRARREAAGAEPAPALG